jgi:hypothetical protein
VEEKPMEPTTAFTLFDKTIAVLGLIRENKKQRTEKPDQALTALYTALAETKAYMADLKSGKPEDKQRQFAIARLWNTASVPLREIDKDLAERCFLKGSYWMEPEAWNQAQLEAKRITIDSVFDATRQLLIR